VIVAGVVPVLGVTVSQLPPLVVDEETVKGIPELPAALLTVKVWEPGLPPTGLVKSNPEAFACNDGGGGLMVSMTATVSGEAPDDALGVSVIVPV
jgi:hypothetical protein